MRVSALHRVTPALRLVLAAAFTLALTIAPADGGPSSASHQAPIPPLQPSAVWAQRDVAGPSGRLGAGIAFDGVRQQIVLFGGYTPSALNDTWTWDGTAWTQVSCPTPVPSARWGMGMAYDAERRQVVMFGGYNGSQWLGDTWVLEGNQWTLKSASGPAGRGWTSMVYDAERKEVVLFGGRGNAGRFGDTWVWNGTTWQQRQVSGPSARNVHAMAYDEARKQVVLFGGWDGATPSGDTWLWNGTQWNQAAVSGPAPRFSHAMAYDAGAQRVVVFGGQLNAAGSSFASDTWTWNGATWQSMANYGPSERLVTSMAFDPPRGQILLFGGQLGGTYYSDTWIYAGLDPAHTLRVTGISPVTASQGDNIQVIVSGANFLSTSVLSFGGTGITANGSAVDGTDRITAWISIDRNAALGTRDVVVSNPDGQQAVLPHAFEIVAPSAPSVSSIEPTSASAGTMVDLTVHGDFFDSGTTLSFGSASITAQYYSLRTRTTIVARIRIANSAPTGASTVSVVRTDAATATYTGSLQILPATPFAGSRAVEVVAGQDYTCLLTANGGVQCWGANSSGQLGDGTTTTRRSTPADVTGLSSGVIAIAAGAYHACAVTTGGGVKCWGNNLSGQLGDGTTTQRSLPVDVVGLSSGVVGITAGEWHTCAVTNTGGVQCWGTNEYGQLGDGTWASRPTPIGVSGLTSGVMSVAAGYAHTCAVMTTGVLKCWGYNDSGQLGVYDEDWGATSVPATVAGITTGVARAALGWCHTCALTVAGGVKCWGRHVEGQLGDGGRDPSASEIVDVTGLDSGVVAIATGDWFSCATTSAGGMRCWGDNDYGQIGDGTTEARFTPVDVRGLAGRIVAIAGGGEHTCAATVDGSVQCWGADTYGQLGVGRTWIVPKPSPVADLGGAASSLAVGGTHSCVVGTDGKVRCWGNNLKGELGDGTTADRAAPVEVLGLSGSASSVDAGGFHTCATTADGRAQCWGDNSGGVLGDGTNTDRWTPVSVSGLTSGVRAVAIGQGQSCALTVTGGVRCWGYNGSGQLGDGTTTDRWTPVDVVGLSSGVAAIAVGENSSCALMTSGGVKCWGFGQAVPATVTGLSSGVTSIAVGDYHGCAVMAGGGVKCWGKNDKGQLGNGATSYLSSPPVDVVGLSSGVVAVAAGFSHTCAVMNTGGVKCWGYNDGGQLGDGTTTDRLTPVDVIGLSGTAIGIAAGGVTCALLTGGGVDCWGGNSSGQIGNGHPSYRPGPTNVTGFGAMVVLGRLRQVYDGTPKAVSVRTTPPGLGVIVTYTGMGATTYGPTQVAPSAVGTYLAVGEVTDPGYAGSGASMAPLTILGPPLSIASVTPSSGPDYTFTRVTIRGTDFRPGATVTDGRPLLSQYIDSTTMVAIVPPGPAISITLSVVNPDGGTVDAEFTRLDYPQIASITPRSGSPGTAVTITGSNFAGDAVFSFGGVAASIMSHTFPTEGVVVAVPPGAPPGLTSVTVTNVLENRSRTYAAAFTVGNSRSSTISAVAVSGYNTCAVMGGGARCWGDNSGGQLGDGTYDPRSTPGDVAGLDSDTIAVAAGMLHACALTGGGGVKCWGYNAEGELGGSWLTNSTTPLDVDGLATGITAIVAGDSHTCALTAGGGVKCWGYNAFGQLGDGTTTNQRTPVDVAGLPLRVVALAAGANHTCALLDDGAVWCWGFNDHGELGDGTTTQREVPIPTSGLTSGVLQLSAGTGHTCAVVQGGLVRCWGANSSGQLGDGTTINRLVPTTVSGLTGAKAVVGGNAHTCAVIEGSGVRCWGTNRGGQLGDGTTVDRPAPGANVVGVPAGATILPVNSTADHTCVVASDGVLRCWGVNPYGQLGDASILARSSPVNVLGLSAATTRLAAGYSDTCALSSDGAVTCWGYNTYGQLGDGTRFYRPTAVGVQGLGGGAVGLSAGRYHVCAVTSAGKAQCWGANSYGQLGDGTKADKSLPADVNGLTNGVSSIAAGDYHSCAVVSGGVRCWGRNNYGQLGNGTTTDGSAPSTVDGLASGVVAVVAGGYHACALLGGGAVKCWGRNSWGQLGNGTYYDSATPVNVTGLVSGVVSLAAGYGHTCALTDTGGLKCWGDNYDGQLGDGTTEHRTRPVDVPGLGVVTAIATGGYHTCAIVSGGGVKCWGFNGGGELGDGSTTSRSAPADVSGLGEAATALAGGTYHTCAATLSGAVRCWGEDTFGALGDGRLVFSAVPIEVRPEKTLATITLGNLSQPYDGAPKPATVTTTPPGLTVTVTYLGTGSTVYGPTTTPPAAVGTYTVIAIIVDPVYQGSANGTLKVGTTASTEVVRPIAAGVSHTCAVIGGGAVCWGKNSDGQLGDGTTTNRLVLGSVTGLGTGVVAVTVGWYHSCALTTTGAVKCWGDNWDGKLGDGTTTNRSTPTAVSGMGSGVVAIASGSDHTCALTSSGGVKCWGLNSAGQLGDGGTTARSVPTPVSGLDNGVVAISAGALHTCALLSNWSVKCWGDNRYGQLGDGTKTNRLTPTVVSGLDGGAVAIAGGGHHTCALTGSGGVACWGNNESGEVGDGTTTSRLTPVPVTVPAGGIRAVTGGGDHTCALTAGGTAMCWGYNAYGQIGDGTKTDRLTPTEVSGLKTGVVAIAGGDQYTCALTTTGVPTCWGQNDAGQLGDGTKINRTTPTVVVTPTATVTLSNLVQRYDGAAKPVTVTTVPAGLTLTVMYTGVGDTRYGPSTTPPEDRGRYSVAATVVDALYQGAATATLIIWREAGTDFDGDGVADLTVFRPSTGEWWVRGQTSAVKLGRAGDIPVVGEFNGDGKTDIAVFRPATGEWFINGQASVQWGRVGDLPVPGDYNNDGVAEIAVYRPSTGEWFIRGQAEATQWGGPDELPVPGDYDGDGTTDIAVYRRATGEWRIRGRETSVMWGMAGDVPVPADYNGESVTEIAVYRPSTGEWFVRYFVYLGPTAQWGNPGDVPVPLDTDGDGAMEIAVYRPSTGSWYVLAHHEWTWVEFQWGAPGDIPVGRQTIMPVHEPGDLDGDRRSDVTVFRPGTGQWFTLGSASGFTQWSGTVLGENGDVPLVGDFLGTRLQQRVAYRPTTGVWRLEDGREIGWGSAGDVPVLGDYDGDGLADIAVYRPATGAWYVLTSQSGYVSSLVFGWGGEGDVPVPGDYDGDGITDIAVYRPSTGTWFVLTSSSAYQQYQIYAWGTAEDVPVVGDFDGDGVSDIAVYRASIGAWYIVTSSSNFMGTLSAAWGGGDDVPVPGDYNGDGYTEVAVYRPATGTWFVMGSAPIEWGAPGDVPVKR